MTFQEFAREVAHWMMREMLAYCRRKECSIADLRKRVRPEAVAELVLMTMEGHELDGA